MQSSDRIRPRLQLANHALGNDGVAGSEPHDTTHASCGCHRRERLPSFIQLYKQVAWKQRCNALVAATRASQRLHYPWQIDFVVLPRKISERQRLAGWFCMNEVPTEHTGEGRIGHTAASETDRRNALAFNH